MKSGEVASPFGDQRVRAFVAHRREKEADVPENAEGYGVRGDGLHAEAQSIAL